MNRIRYRGLAMLTICSFLVLGAGLAQATPVPNGALLIPRFFNDCPVTVLSTSNLYPFGVQFDESFLVCAGGVNLHLWNLSADGGLTSAVFNNKDGFDFAANLMLQNVVGAVGTEGGLRLSPWWDQNANGYFNVRLPDGEIAVFGGVLPFYSFTAAYGIHYLDNQVIRLEMIYNPHCNTANDPGTIEYKVVWQGQTYSSGPLPFNNCTPGEEIHGCYGIMDDARVGGRVQNNFFAGGGDPAARNQGTFLDITFAAVPGQDCPVPTETKTWGSLKALYR